MRMREELKADITNLIDITEFGNEYDEDKTYQYLKTQIEIMLTEKDKDDYSLSLDNVVDLINILNDSDNYTLRDSLFAMLDYLNKDSVGTNKIRVVAEQEEETFIKMVYTIEYGKIIEVDGLYEKYCTNEVNFIDEPTYKNYLVDAIKEKYSSSYNIANKVKQIICKNLSVNNVSEYEIAYLAMNIERFRILKLDN